MSSGSASQPPSSDGDAIKVFVRVRPEEPPGDLQPCVAVDHGHNAIVVHAKPEAKIFTYDHVADSECSQETVFSTVGRTIIDSCVQGYNGTIFAYGQTGSGKTFTMLGPSEDSDNFQHELRGVIPRSFEYLFSIISHQKQMNNTDFLCKCSFLEIYNEQVFDLLDTSSPSLNLRENIKRGVYADGLTEISVTNAAEAYEVLTNGWLNRRVASTSMNRESSRSHAVFTVQIESKETKDGIKNLRSSLLNLVDLAGSERQKDTKAVGQRLKEACSINNSLSTLGNVIMSLVDIAHGKSRYVPYRDSKLSFLLRDSLGGNAKTCIIGCVHPGSKCFGETLSTLQFVRRAKMIKNKASVNEDTSGGVAVLQAEIKKLKECLLQYQSGMLTVEPAAPSVEVSGDCRLWQSHFLHAMLFRERAIEEQQALHAKMSQMEEMCNKKERVVQSTKMIIKFRESHISRLQKQLKENKLNIEETTSALVDDMKQEIDALKEQVNHNPVVTKYAMENQSLRSELKKVKDVSFVTQQQADLKRLAELEEVLVKLKAETGLQATSTDSEMLYSTPQTGDNGVAVATIQKYKSQINTLQSQVDSLKQELCEQSEVHKKQQAEMESKLAAHSKTILEMEKILEAQQLSSMVERKSLTDMHMETIKTMTTPKKTYELRNRTIIAPSMDGSFLADSDALITEENEPEEMKELATEALTEEINKLNEQNARLRSEMESKEQAMLSLKQSVSELEHKFQHSSSAHSQAVQNIADLQRQVENISTALAETTQREDALKMEVRDLKIVLDASDKELFNVKTQKKEVSEIQSQELEAMSMKLIRIEGELLSLQKEKDIVQNEKELLQETCDMTQTTLDFKEEQLTSLEQRLANELKEKEGLERSLQTHMERLEQEKQVNVTLTAQLNDAGREQEKQILTTLEELDSLRVEKDSLLVKLTSIEENYRSAAQEVDTSRLSQARLERTLEESKESVAKLMTEIQKMRTNKMMQDEDVEDLTCQLSEKMKEIESLEHTVGDQARNIQEKERQLEALAEKRVEEVKELQAENTKLCEERDGLQDGVRQSLMELELAQAEVKNKDELVQALSEQLTAEQVKMSELKAEFECKLRNAQEQALQQEANVTEELIDQQKAQLAEYKSTCNTLKESLNDVQNILQEKRLEIKALQDAVEEGHKLKIDLENVVQKCATLERQVEEHGVELRQREERVSQLEDQLHSSEITNSQLRQEKYGLEFKYNALESQNASLTDNCSELESANQRLRQNLDNAYLRTTEVQHEVEEAKEARSKLEKELRAKEENLEILRSENAKLVGHQNPKQKIQHHLAIKDENNTLREEVAKLTAEVYRLQKKRHNSTPLKELNPGAKQRLVDYKTS